MKSSKLHRFYAKLFRPTLPHDNKISPIVFRTWTRCFFQQMRELSLVGTKLESNNFSTLYINLRGTSKSFDAFKSFLSLACHIQVLWITECNKHGAINLPKKVLCLIFQIICWCTNAETIKQIKVKRQIVYIHTQFLKFYAVWGSQ